MATIAIRIEKGDPARIIVLVWKGQKSRQQGFRGGDLFVHKTAERAIDRSVTVSDRIGSERPPRADGL